MQQELCTAQQGRSLNEQHTSNIVHGAPEAPKTLDGCSIDGIHSMSRKVGNATPFGLEQDATVSVGNCSCNDSDTSAERHSSKELHIT